MIVTLGMVMMVGGGARADGGRELLEVTFENMKKAPRLSTVANVVKGSEVLLWGTAKRFAHVGAPIHNKLKHKTSSHTFWVSAPRGTDVDALSKQLRQHGVSVIRPGGRPVDAFNSISVTIHGKVAGKRVAEVAHVPLSRVMKDPTLVTKPHKMLKYTDGTFRNNVKKLGIKGAKVRLRTWAMDRGTALKVPTRVRARAAYRKMVRAVTPRSTRR